MLTILRILAACLTFAGSVMVALSVAKNPHDAHQMVNGKIKYLAIIHLERFRWGMGLMVFGFFLQMITEVATMRG
ncbi:hypothetical protein AUJ46_00245 [Candidatus Peregrinibacteria bacterium CG1_02_54_53]|nr:MAG: hypothetical protein AUJ46_00245 [Candidatus Peregrinibacteria bacterium CG1_02_54_53]